MIIKYLNEGAFGNYKNKTSKEDKLKNLKDETERIMNKAFKDLDFEVKCAVYKTICDNEGQCICEDIKAFCQIWDDGYDFVENNKGEKLECNFQTLYKVSDDKDSVIIYTRVPVYAIAFDGVHGGAKNCVFLDDMITNEYGSKVNLKKILLKAEENMYFSYHELNEKLCDWFGVNHVYWYYRFHLVSRREPEKLFNENIFYRHIAINEGNLSDLIHNVIEAFDWFTLKCNIFRCFNISVNCNGDNNCRILGEISKWIKTNELQLIFPFKNNIESLGDYHRLFLSEEESKKLESIIPSSFYDKIDRGVVDMSCDMNFEFYKGLPILTAPKNYVFTDKLLTNLFGYDNKSILNISMTKLTDDNDWKCTQIIYNINNIEDTLKVFCTECYPSKRNDN